MAFSLFGKKPAPRPEAERPPAKGGAGARPAAKAESDDELSSLDFTLPGEVPKSGRSRIEVEESSHQVPEAVEQAAMLFSVEQTEQAESVLESAIRHERLNRYERRAWGMLFDLYQLQGRRDAFETLALEFAAKFETSPPTWMAAAAEERDPMLATGGGAFVSLAGPLNGKSLDTLKLLLKNAEKNPTVRLDMAKVTDADEQGCGLLQNVLVRLKKSGKECVLSGADRLAALLAKKITPGTREREQTWLLLLTLHQQTYQQEAFEDVAVNYAITFEVSPPSWEAPKAKPAASAGQPEPVMPVTPACSLEGELVAVDEAAFSRIRMQAETSDDVVVDVGKLVRMDFIAAAHLLNVLNELVSAGKKVSLIKASHLVTALWEVIGLDRVARVETRKT